MTVRQIQNLLQYLGYYTADVDGIWGPVSKQATEDFQRDFGGIGVDGVPGNETQKALKHAIAYGMPVSEESTAEADGAAEADWWPSIRYWSRVEFGCLCSEYHEPYCDGFPVEPDRTLVELVDDLRHNFGRPAHATSGIRCERHNADQPNSAKNSKHRFGKALDFWIEGVSGEQLLAAALKDPRTNYAYIIKPGEPYVHVDVK